MLFATYCLIEEDWYVMFLLGDGFKLLLPSDLIFLACDMAVPAIDVNFSLNLLFKGGYS